MLKRPHSHSGIGQKHFHVSSIDLSRRMKTTIVDGGDSSSEFVHMNFPNPSEVSAPNENDSCFSKMENTLSGMMLEGMVLLEPVYDRVFDIGTTFEIVDGVITRQFMVENFISESGAFAGGIGSNTLLKFKEYILLKYSYDLVVLENISKDIVAAYLNLGADSNVQIDSFVYRDRLTRDLKLYTLVEVNYRKTMGMVIQALADKHPEAPWVEWRIEPVKSLKGRIYPHITEEDQTLYSDWVKISPEGNHFQSFYRHRLQ